MSRVPVELATAAQTRSALQHPDSGTTQFGWDGFDVLWHLYPPGFPQADRAGAKRRITYVADLDAELDAAYALDPIGRLAQDVAMTTRWGPSTLAALRGEFGFTPGRLRAPDSEGPVSFSPHGVVVLLGHFGPDDSTELETWSCSTSHDVVGADVGAMPNTLGATALEAIFDNWSGVISAGSNGAFGSETWLDGVAYYRKQADGTSTTGVWERYLSPDPVAGVGGPQLPYQNALVVTEDAGGARKGRFGRFYLPAPGASIANGVLPSAAVTAVAGNVVAALTAVNTIINGVVGDDTEVVVASAIGSGENRPVRRIRLGNVVDTQRRRRRSLAETYLNTPFQSIP